MNPFQSHLDTGTICPTVTNGAHAKSHMENFSRVATLSHEVHAEKKGNNIIEEDTYSSSIVNKSFKIIC